MLAGPAAAASEGGRASREALLRALELYRTGDCDGAAPLLRQVVTDQPWNVAARRLLGNCSLRAQQWTEARTHFEAILRLAPDDSAALRGLRDALAAGQRIEEARQTELIQSRRTREKQLRVDYELRDALTLLDGGRLEEAEHLLRRILEKRPEDRTAAARLAELCSASQRFHEAARLYEGLASAEDGAAQHLLRAAQNLEWGGDDAAAVVSYRRYLARAPEDVAARLALGRALARNERCREAVAELGAAARHRSQDAGVHLELARCYDALGRAESALAAYEAAARLDDSAAELRAIVAQRRRDAEEAPLRRAFQALDAGDHATAVVELTAYLAAHPDSAETRLQLARVLSWSGRPAEAIRAYGVYLELRNDDRQARRERAQLLAWHGEMAAAGREYASLAANAESDADACSDLEALLLLQRQAGDPGAEESARRLVQLAPDHAEAQRVLEEGAMRRRAADRDAAQALTAKGQFREAAEAYGRYQEQYGADPELGLQIARLRSWAREYDAAVEAYRRLLEADPQQPAVRAELAAVLSWAGRGAEAEAEYGRVLQERPGDVGALLGLAQLSDQRGDDRVRVLRSYEHVVARDQALAPTLEPRIGELKNEVAPRPRLSGDRFVDSDGLELVTGGAEMDITLEGRVVLTPLVAYVRSEQLRAVPGDSAAVAAFNRELERRRGRMEGAGAGGRLVARPGGAWRVLGEAGLLGFEGGRTSLNLRLEAALDRGPREPGLAVQYRRGEAVHDLNSGAVLAAGVRGDSLLVSGWRGIGQSRFEGQPLLKAWLAVRSTFYSEGASGSFAANRQDLVSARLDWQLSRSLRLAPVFRASRFSERSPLYFSPGQDVVGLLSARLEARRRRLVASLTLEGGYERIDGRGVAPVLIQPILEWTIRPALPLRLSYSFGRSGASAFGSASYSSQRLALTMSGSF